MEALNDALKQKHDALQAQIAAARALTDSLRAVERGESLVDSVATGDPDSARWWRRYFLDAAFPKAEQNGAPPVLRTDFNMSASARNPSQKTRNVTRMTPADTLETVALDNPFDYEIGIGMVGTYGDLRFTMNYEFERQNSFNFVNQDYSFQKSPRAYEFGLRLRDHEAGNQYMLQVWLLAKLYGWVGVGATRRYTVPWIEEGATMLSFSLARNTFHVSFVELRVEMKYDINPNQSGQYFKVQVQNFKFGRFSLVPFFRLDRIKRKDFAATTAYQAKVNLRFSI